VGDDNVKVTGEIDDETRFGYWAELRAPDGRVLKRVEDVIHSKANVFVGPPPAEVKVLLDREVLALAAQVFPFLRVVVIPEGHTHAATRLPTSALDRTLITTDAPNEIRSEVQYRFKGHPTMISNSVDVKIKRAPSPAGVEAPKLG